MKFRHFIVYCFLLVNLTACTSYLNYDHLEPLPRAKLPNHPRVILVLSGGGSKALSQLGALEILHQHQMPIDLIIGTSSGSLIGALYADTLAPLYLKNELIHLEQDSLLHFEYVSLFNMLWRIEGLDKGCRLNQFIKRALSSQYFHELKIPLIVVTTDIERNQIYSIHSGQLAPAIHAASAIPILFSPVKLYGRTLVDGGVISPVPIDVAKEFKPNLIIAIDVGSPPSNGPLDGNMDLAYRSLWLTYYSLSQWQTEQADVLIRPDTSGFGIFDDSSNEKLYEAGRKAALAALPKIQAALGQLNKN